MSRQFPHARLRRPRSQPFSRRLVQEHVLTAADLIYPTFIIEGDNEQQAVPSMPGVTRKTIDLLLEDAFAAAELGIPLMALFPVVPAEKKTASGEESHRADGLVQTAIRALKAANINIGIMADVALDPYTSHGQDGLIDDDGYVVNDPTVEVLVKQALSQAEAGVDIIAPSDMMDGRILAIRQALEAAGHINTQIMAYSAKYASGYYGPFRDAANSSPKGFDRSSYQLPVTDRKKAINSSIINAAQGANYLMVKPGMTSIDLIAHIKKETLLPTGAYQVSGEFASLKLLEANRLGKYPELLKESLNVFSRAKADFIITYGARDIVKYI